MNKLPEVPIGGLDSSVDRGSPPPASRSFTRETKPTRGGSLLIGRLTEHRRANYQFRSDENASYYVKLLTSRGAKTLWGKDLERALTRRDPT
jgi:hypothetical protein